MFFETKNPISSQGDIAAAVSKDAGTTWQQLGVVLDEEWHLSYPYVFSYGNEVNILFMYWGKLCIIDHIFLSISVFLSFALLDRLT
jgi:hypothetical protein